MSPRQRQGNRFILSSKNTTRSSTRDGNWFTPKITIPTTGPLLRRSFWEGTKTKLHYIIWQGIPPSAITCWKKNRPKPASWNAFFRNGFRKCGQIIAITTKPVSRAGLHVDPDDTGWLPPDRSLP